MAGPEVNVDVKGVKETMRRLNSFAPEQAKLINKKIRGEANKIRDRARDYMPNTTLSNWNNWPAHASEGYVGSMVKKGVKTTKANSRARGARYSNYIAIVNSDAAGSIFQTVGRGSSNDYFVTNMLERFPEPRGLWRAFDELKSEVGAAIMEAVREAEALVSDRQAELDTLVAEAKKESQQLQAQMDKTQYTILP
ncbi:MAG TPA: hypothetical protein VLA24_16835 [Pseudomonadales bacterium]|nr:hypothetical protein [Pseudomonadales bacterium]